MKSVINKILGFSMALNSIAHVSRGVHLPLFSKNSAAFYKLYVYFPPYFDHDALTERPCMSVNICERLCLHQICITIISSHHLFLVYGSLLELNLCRPTIAYFNTWAQLVSNAFPSQFPRLGVFRLLKFLSSCH